MTGEEPEEVRSGRWIVTSVEVVDGPFDPAVDGPSNAQVLCAGICTRGTLVALLGVELAWMIGQLAGRWLLGRCFDPPPFVLLHRANLFLAMGVVALVCRAGKDSRVRQRSRLERDRLRQGKAEEVRAGIAKGLEKRLEAGRGSLH